MQKSIFFLQYIVMVAIGTLSTYTVVPTALSAYSDFNFTGLIAQPPLEQSVSIDQWAALLMQDKTGTDTAALQEAIFTQLLLVLEYQLSLRASLQDQKYMRSLIATCMQSSLLRPLLAIVTLEVLRHQLGIENISRDARMRSVQREAEMRLGPGSSLPADLVHYVRVMRTHVPPYGIAKTSTMQRLALWGSIASIMLKLTMAIGIIAGVYMSYNMLHRAVFGENGLMSRIEVATLDFMKNLNTRVDTVAHKSDVVLSRFEKMAETLNDRSSESVWGLFKSKKPSY